MRPIVIFSFFSLTECHQCKLSVHRHLSAKPMITDLLSASALPARLSLGVNLRSSSSHSKQPSSMAPSMISPPLFSPQSNGLPSGPTASPSTSSSRGLASPSSHYHTSAHSSSQSSNRSSNQLYRYMKQQYHLPDKLDLIDLSGEAKSTSASPNNQLGICAACDLPQYSTFGPFSAKIAKSRQVLSNENIALKVSVSSYIQLPFPPFYVILFLVDINCYQYPFLYFSSSCSVKHHNVSSI